MLSGRFSGRLGTLDLQIAISADAGEVVAVVGPNGAGKTTLLRSLAGLVPLQDAYVAVDGVVLEDSASGVSIPTERRPIGFVFQDYLLFPHLSALDNVAFGLRSRGMGREPARREAENWLNRMELGQAGKAKPKALSGGQRQKVALARALADAAPASLARRTPCRGGRVGAGRTSTEPAAGARAIRRRGRDRDA